MGHGYTQRQCEVCGIIFRARNDSIKAGMGKYCSRKCFGIATKTQVTQECECCHKLFQIDLNVFEKGGGKYCSQYCKAATQLKGENKICIHCGVSFFASRSELDRGLGKYCSRNCYFNHNVGINHSNWRGGSFYSWGLNWKIQRKLAYERDNGACQYCGLTEQQGLAKYGKKNAVHHIVKRREFRNRGEPVENANALTNLVTLCQPDHLRAEHGKITIQPKLL